MENKGRKAARVLLLVVMTVCLIPFGQAYGQSVQHRAQQEDLKQRVTEALLQNPVQTNSVPQEMTVSVLLEQTDGAQEISVGDPLEQKAEKPVMLQQ